ncbi:MAG: nitrous oxide reductase accessory protein NosL [Bacteroidetes bacterium]|nr:nitrous oxide reductase accessory protein NosL [Bacteroidota bacterium]
MKTLMISLILSLFLLTSCGNASSPDPINFGSDLCAHCNMKIMDKRFGAEILTGKGKSFKFDAAECMFEYMKSNNTDNVTYWVVDYNNPGSLINALKSFYLISLKIKSPMGEFLSCYSDSGAANESKSANGGDVYGWCEINAKFGTGK